MRRSHILAFVLPALLLVVAPAAAVAAPCTDTAVVTAATGPEPLQKVVGDTVRMNDVIELPAGATLTLEHAGVTYRYAAGSSFWVFCAGKRIGFMLEAGGVRIEAPKARSRAAGGYTPDARFLPIGRGLVRFDITRDRDQRTTTGRTLRRSLPFRVTSAARGGKPSVCKPGRAVTVDANGKITT